VDDLAKDETSPTQAAKTLLAQLIEPTPTRDAGHVAIALRPQSARVIARLVTFHEGFEKETSQRVMQISRVAAQLLEELSKLRRARAYSRTGRTLADDFIEGTAPRLFPLAKELQELLEGP
jgi:hypothetical protein